MHNQILFNEFTHEYTLQGQKLRSVTQQLREYGLAPKFFNKFAGLRGTYVHRAIHLALLEKLNLNTLDARIRPYYDSFDKFRQKNNLNTFEAEYRVGSLLYQTAGTLDWWGNLNGEVIILDWKTSQKIDKSTFLQIAFYKKLLNSEGQAPQVDKAGIVHLKPDGTEAELIIPESLEKEEKIIDSIITIETYRSKL